MDIVKEGAPLRKRRRRVLRIAVAVIGAFLVVLAAAMLANRAPALERSQLSVSAVKRGEFHRTIRGSGRLVPKQMRWLSSRTAGRVETVVSDAGTNVGDDTLILELSNPAVVESYLAAESAYAAARAEFEAKRAEAKENELERQASQAALASTYQIANAQAEAEKHGFDRGVISKVQYQRTEIEARELGNRVEIQRQKDRQSKRADAARDSAERARLHQVERTLDLRRDERDSLRVISGLPGTVQEVVVEEGQQVEPGMKLARISGTGGLVAELKIPESQANGVEVGQAVVLRTRSGLLQGRVTRISPRVESGTLLVEASLPDSLPRDLRADQSVDAEIQLHTIKDAFFVRRPVGAVSGTETSVFVLSDDNSASKKRVRFGVESDGYIQVYGLQAGDRVVTSDVSAIEDSSRFRIN